MKKLFIAFASTTVLLSSCNLDLAPKTALSEEEAATVEYIDAMSAGLYTGLKSVTSGGYLYYADYQSDLFNETTQSGNRGGFFARWNLYDNDQDINSMWSGYYSLIDRANFGLQVIDELENKDAEGEYADDIAFYRAEFHFFRAYLMHQLALRFCKDYEPATAATDPGVPCPKEHNPNAQLARGTLADTYKFILDDLKAAEDLQYYTYGEPDSYYVTIDAVTALKAQVALQMHDYDNASAYAASLYDTYALASSPEELDDMWHLDISTESILTLEVNSTTSLGTVGSMSDYYNGGWNTNFDAYVCTPAYVPCAHVAEAFDPEKDYRYGVYASEEILNVGGRATYAILMNKFTGNTSFQTSETVLTYRHMPKVFRIAEMYLIDAEAQYRNGGDAATPLNALRQARGLDATEATGEALFEEIKMERLREMLGEGHRLTDLKRWHDGYSVQCQEALESFVRGQSRTKEASDNKFVWPIPIEEISTNGSISNADQNPGY